MDVLAIGLPLGAIYGLIAIGIVLVYKATKVLNFAQAEFGTFGLYVSWALTTKGVPVALSALISVLVMTLVGLSFERLVVNPMKSASRVALSVVTAGLLYFLFAVELKIWRTSPRIAEIPIKGDGVSFGGLSFSPMQMIALLVLAAAGLGLGLLISRSRFGLGLLAVASDAPTAQLMGVPYDRISMATWSAAGALGAIAGLLIGPLQGVFAPLSLTSSLFVPGLTAALLGGLTALPGAFAGGLLVGVIETTLRVNFPQTVGIGSYGMLGVILLVLLVRPRGLLGREA